MTANLSCLASTDEYQTQASVASDRGPVETALAKIGFAKTPNAAHTRLVKLRTDLAATAKALLSVGGAKELDRLLLPAREMQEAGVTVDLHPETLSEIAQANGDQHAAFTGFALRQTAPAARELFRKTLRDIEGNLMLTRWLRRRFPEVQ